MVKIVLILSFISALCGAFAIVYSIRMGEKANDD